MGPNMLRVDEEEKPEVRNRVNMSSAEDVPSLNYIYVNSSGLTDPYQCESQVRVRTSESNSSHSLNPHKRQQLSQASDRQEEPPSPMIVM
mmetsp:Transcript_24287/g.18476  ORF Transcript_24287/g.18476 Transcript_24287/m.18476 type:complete len:90 (-) Transcript_24287:104-373(-)